MCPGVQEGEVLWEPDGELDGENDPVVDPDGDGEKEGLWLTLSVGTRLGLGECDELLEGEPEGLGECVVE